jgi:hypothetical protein
VRQLAKGSFAASVFAISFVSTGHTQVLGPLVQVTGPDPFTSCTKDNVGQQETTFGSVLYPNTVIEPWVAVDPTDASRLLVGHQQDRWSDGGARGDIDALSNNGGATWTNPIPPNPPNVTECTGGKDARASDPWVVFANDGTALFMSLVLNPAKPQTPFGARQSGMFASRSTDHGQTWSAPIALITNNSPHVLNDKNSMTADPTENGVVYAVWDQLSVFPKTDEGAATIAQNDGVVIARESLNAAVGNSAVCVPFGPPCKLGKGGAPFHTFNYTGPTLLALSANNGASWSPAAAIFSPGSGTTPGTGKQTIDNLVQVTPDGTVFDFFTYMDTTPLPTGSPIVNIEYIKSTTKGLNWSTPTFVTDIQVAGVVTPDTGGPIRDASTLFAVSANPVNGAIYVTWQDFRLSGATCTPPLASPSFTIPVDGVLFTQSIDGGATWTKPIQINKTPANATNPCRQQAFVPAVVASGDGTTVVVTYYDFRNDTNSPAGFEGTDYFAIFCSTASDCSKAASWGNEQRLTTASFNILNAPIARGHFLGDYMGLAASGPTTVYPVFGIATAPNVTVEYTRSISGLP